MPIALRREGVDLFHAPHYVLPPLTPCKSVVTIHDCIHLRFPQYLPQPARLRLRARVDVDGGAPIRPRADRLGGLQARHPAVLPRAAESKIDVIYNAIDERFGETPADEEIARVRERYQLNDPFVLYAGNIKPHKNLERLIEAFHTLRRGGFDEVKLLIIGDEISKYATLRRAVHKYKLHKHVRFFGFVSGPDAGGALPAGGGVRVPVALRGVRPAAARGHGERHARSSPPTCRRCRRSWATRRS